MRKGRKPVEELGEAHRKAHRAELDVISLFRSKKHRVRALPYIGDGDVLVDDQIKLEVKTASPQVKPDKNGQLYWCFNIHRHGVLKEQSDYYVFQFRDVPGMNKPLYAAFKAPLGVLTVSFSIRTLILRFSHASNLFEDLLNAPVIKREWSVA